MYVPDKKILEKYADLLVNFALGGGEGIKKGEVIFCVMEDEAKPLMLELQTTILKAGGHPMKRMIPTGGFSRNFFELASDEQLEFFAKDYMKSRVDLMDHQIGIIADVDPFELKGVDPQKIFKSRDAKREYMDWRTEKENKGKFTWTLGLYGTEAMAREAGLSIEEYWDEIIKGCYLDKEDPKAEWRKIMDEQERLKKKLDNLGIESVHVKSENIDLTVKLGADRKWMGGSGRNVPSYELFISPDWRGTEGHIYFNQPLYRFGTVVKGVRLEFKEGVVVKAEAEQGQEVIEQMIKSENADKIGEFSLTDKKFSRITKFMANTLFDENVGGEFGNTHLALGKSYHDSYPGDPSEPTKEQWAEMGYNDSPEHTDIMSTEDRTVTATLSDGSAMVIYENGEFIV